ncbi:MAG: signal peptidase I [Suilimivivens sp.]|nr:signal peptidase I [Lachnospiraceae bacterium]MDY5869755.1 signal peptidase I [Lachnospiraceae bacterium]
MNKRLKDILSTSIYFLIVLILTFLVVTYVGQRTMVIGSSMEPMLSDGDNLIVDKLSYRFNEPQRFDIIVFPFRYAEKTYYIKRIIGLPGETVFIDENGTIFINGEELQESYGKEIIKDPGRAYEPITLGEDEYFVLGDNRNNSSDSRDPVVGNIHRDEFIGKAWMRIWPFSKMGMIKHQ